MNFIRLKKCQKLNRHTCHDINNKALTEIFLKPPLKRSIRLINCHRDTVCVCSPCGLHLTPEKQSVLGRLLFFAVFRLNANVLNLSDTIPTKICSCASTTHSEAHTHQSQPLSPLPFIPIIIYYMWHLPTCNHIHSLRQNCKHYLTYGFNWIILILLNLSNTTSTCTFTAKKHVNQWEKTTTVSWPGSAEWWSRWGPGWGGGCHQQCHASPCSRDERAVLWGTAELCPRSPDSEFAYDLLWASAVGNTNHYTIITSRSTTKLYNFVKMKTKIVQINWEINCTVRILLFFLCPHQWS